MPSPNHWPAYVQALRVETGLSQTEFAARALGKKSQQGKISRWESGEGNPPDRAADVAAFARALDRNPLEAFVAAGMLEIDEAGRGLETDSRELLKIVSMTGAGKTESFLLREMVLKWSEQWRLRRTDELAERRAQRGAVPSDLPDTITDDDLIGQPSVAEPERDDHEGDKDPEEP